MQYNDLSNQGGKTIGVDLKILLTVEKEPNLAEKITTFFNKKPVYAIDERVNISLRKLYLNSSYNVEVVIDEYFWKHLPTKIKNQLQGANYINITFVKSFMDIHTYMVEGIYQYFITEDRYTSMLVAHYCCINMSDFARISNWRLS